MIVRTHKYADFKSAITAIGGALGGTVLYVDDTASSGTFYVLAFFTSNGSVHAVEAELTSAPGSLGSDFALTVQLVARPTLR